MKTLHIKKTGLAALVAFALLAVTFYVAQAVTTLDEQTAISTYESYAHYTVANATTTQATSTDLSIAGAKKVQAYFAYNDGSGTATSTFSIEVSPNGGTDWYDFNKLVSNVTNTNSQELTRVGSDQMVGTSSAMYALDLQHDTFDRVRCIVEFASTTVTTTDNATCEITIEQ